MSVTKWAAAGLAAIQVGARNSSGAFAGYAKLEATDTGDVSGMNRLNGALTAPFNLPQPVTRPVVGDNRLITSFDFGAREVVSVTFDQAITDLDAEAFMQQGSVQTIGELRFGGRGGSKRKLQDMLVLLTRDAVAQDGTDASGYDNLFILNSTFDPAGDDQFADTEVGGSRYNALLRNVSLLPTGQTTLAALGKGSTTVWEAYSEYPLTCACIIGDGTSDPVTLPYAPISVGKTHLFRFDTAAEATISSVSAGSKTLTPSAALTSGKFYFAIWQTDELLVDDY